MGVLPRDGCTRRPARQHKRHFPAKNTLKSKLDIDVRKLKDGSAKKLLDFMRNPEKFRHAKLGFAPQYNECTGIVLVKAIQSKNLPHQLKLCQVMCILRANVKPHCTIRAYNQN